MIYLIINHSHKIFIIIKLNLAINGYDCTAQRNARFGSLSLIWREECNVLF